MGLFLLLIPAMLIAETALILKVGVSIGFWPTVAMVIFTAVVGGALARQQGTKAWNDLQTSIAEGVPPDDILAIGISVFVGAALLATPGFITDALGFGLLIPWSRKWIWVFIRKYVWVAPTRSGRVVMNSRIYAQRQSGFEGEVFEASFDEEEPHNSTK